MILITGATGAIGARLLNRLVAAGHPVRCLVRDPRTLGPQRVRVQIAVGDLLDERALSNAMRGVDTVMHLAGTIRDQPRGTIEELNGLATWRLVKAAEHQSVERLFFLTALGTSAHARARFLRSKAFADSAVAQSSVQSCSFASSLVYSSSDMWLAWLRRIAPFLPVVPVTGDGKSLFQPIWAEDAADAVMAAFGGRDQHAGLFDPDLNHRRIELVGPEIISHDQLVRGVLRASRLRRPLVHVPTPIVRQALDVLHTLLGPNAFANWDEAELLQCSMLGERGTADVEALGVSPLTLVAALG